MLAIIVIVSAVCMYSISNLKNTKTQVGDKGYTISEILSKFGADDGEEGGEDILTDNAIFDALDVTNQQIAIAYVNIFVVATLAIFFGGLLTILFPKRVTKPILRLVKATKNVKDGDFSYRVKDINGSNEISDLINSFNKMLKTIEAEHNSLEERNAELKEKNELNKKLLEETKNFNQALEDKIKEVTDELESKHSELVKSEKLATIGEIATKIAHEIRNPLSGITVALENLKGKINTQDEKDMASDIITEVNRLDNIITELFQLAIPRHVKLTEGDPDEMIERVISLITPRAESKVINIEKELGYSGKPVYMDYEQIQQVLMNIVINAIDAIDEQGGTIKIESTYEDNFLKISVTDSGQGIDVDDQQAIFQPFFSTKPGGTGLGLPISAKIVEAHNGEIVIESKNGEGSKFSILIPTDLTEDKLTQV